MASWRLAKSLEELRRQVNAKWPKRSRTHDGSIGDAKHASRHSDHNPHVKDGRQGVVTAIDITHDTTHGPTISRLAEALRASRDHRIKYLICNGKICSYTKDPWKWRRYTGTNPHDKHLHVSVRGLKSLYDNTQSWIIT